MAGAGTLPRAAAPPRRHSEDEDAHLRWHDHQFVDPLWRDRVQSVFPVGDVLGDGALPLKDLAPLLQCLHCHGPALRTLRH